MSGRAEETQERAEEDELSLPFLPFSYYEKKGMEEPPKSISEFLKDSTPFLAIAGALIGLMGLFNNLNPTANRSIAIGAVGTAIFFLIIFGIVVNHAFIEVAKAYKSDLMMIGMTYGALTASLMFIVIGLVSHFGRFQGVAVDVIDGVVGITLLFGFLFFLQGAFTTPTWLENSDPPFQIHLGKYTEIIARKSPQITGMTWLLVAGLMYFNVIELNVPTLPDYVPTTGPTVSMVITFSGLALGIVATIAFAGLANLVYRKVTGLSGAETV